MALSDVLSRCIGQWQSKGLTLAPPIAETEVRRVWGGLRREPSADVLELYATVGGFQDYTFEEDFFWSLWPWDWLQKRNEESPRDGIMFCDHSIEIVTWELRYETAKHSSVWSSHGDQRLRHANLPADFRNLLPAGQLHFRFTQLTDDLLRLELLTSCHGMLSFG